MNQIHHTLAFRCLRGCIQLFYPKYAIHVPDHENEPVVYVSHHQNLFGPFIVLLWYPEAVRVWMLHVFLDRKACFSQYADFTFTERFGWNRTLAKLVAWPLSLAVPAAMRASGGIPVYRKSRKIVSTFKVSIDALKSGFPVAIFPDIDYSNSSSRMRDMYGGFLYLEKLYARETGKHICFIPLYVSKKRRCIIADEKIHFHDGVDFHEESKRVAAAIRNSLNRLAEKCQDT